MRRPAANSGLQEIVDPDLYNGAEPSCSAVEVPERPGPFINPAVAQHALALLARLFRFGEVSYDGGFINLASGIASAVRIDRAGGNECGQRGAAGAEPVSCTA
jgi:hypothetical protein